MRHEWKNQLIRAAAVLLLIVGMLAVYQPALAATSMVSMSSSVSTSTGTAGTSPQRSGPVQSSDRSAAPVRSQYPAGVEAAREALAARLRAPIDSVKVVSYQFVYWRDSCLGIYYGHEGCLLVITPGYRVVLEAYGSTYVAHTDLYGKIIRWETSAAVN